MRKFFKKTPKQVEAMDLIGDHMHTLLYGGSRSAKTFINCYTILVRANDRPSRHVIFRQHFKDVKASVGMETMPKVLDLCLGLDIKPNKTDWFWTFPNGSEIWLAGLDDKERTEKVLGKEYSTIFFNECSQISFGSAETALTRLAENSGLTLRALYDCNPPRKKHWSYKVFIELTDPKDGTPLDPALYGSMLMNPEDNKDNLPDGYIENVLKKLSKRKRQRFLDGIWLDDVDGALWNDNMISAFRVKQEDVPPLVRIVVGVDPAGTAKKDEEDGEWKGTETGVVCAGKDAIGDVYVLEDCTLVGKPNAWGTAVVGCYRRNKADRVVGERNFGGDMVENTIRTIDASVSYSDVTATRGKILRAEPVSALYEQGRVHHVGVFPEMEDEMCSFTGTDPSEPSPNRLDALVWAVTKLGLTPERLTVHTSAHREQDDPPQHEDDHLRALMDGDEAWDRL